MPLARFLIALCLSLAAARAQDPLWPRPEGVQRIAVIGCLRQSEPFPALHRTLSLKPDLALWVGDNIYADTEKDPQVLLDCYAILGADSSFRALKKAVPFAVTWDDHDYGDNNETKHYALRDQSRAIFRQFWGLEDQIPESQDGIWHAHRIESKGKVLQVILLDVRSHKDHPGAEADMLGETQWQWLEGVLREPADLRLLVSGTQILVPAESGSETWDQYPKAQARLFETIRASKADRIVCVTGDQHYAEVARLPRALDHDLIELQFAGVNQIEENEFNPLRVTAPIHSKHSYAWIDVQWEDSDTEVAHLNFRVADALTNQVELSYRVNFAEITLRPRLVGPDRFLKSLKVQLAAPYENLAIRYTLDGTIPSADSPLFEPRLAANSAPALEVEATTVLTAALFNRKGQRRGAPIEVQLLQETLLPGVLVGDLAPGLRYRSFVGDFTAALPDFSALAPVAEGIAEDLNPKRLAPRPERFAIAFEGYLEVSASGLYRLATESDDGSRLSIGNRLVVDNDGSHSARLREGLIALAAGLHPLRIDYFQHSMGTRLRLYWAEEGARLRRIPSDHLLHAR